MNPFSPLTATLKNGKTVRIREATPEDAENLLHCIKTYIPQSEYIPKHPQEITLTLKGEEDWINSFLQKENSMLLVAEHEDRLIGNIDLTGSSRKIMEHTAMIGLGMLKEWRNTGLGTRLMQTTLQWARQNPTLELLWLQVYTQNKAAVRLYSNMGFTESGIIKNYFKCDGVYYDNLTMSLSVKS